MEAAAGGAGSSGASPVPRKAGNNAVSTGRAGNDKDRRRHQRKKSPSPATTNNAQRAPAASGHFKKPTRNSPFNTKMEPPFEEYWKKEAVQCGLKQKELIQGVLRINQRNYVDAYVDDPEGGGDFYISGIQMRNRALEGDVVVLQVLPPEKWLDEVRFPLSSESQKLPTLQDFSPALDSLQTSSSVSSSEAEEVTKTQSSGSSDTPPPPPPPSTLIEKLYTIPEEMRVGRKREEEEEEETRGEAHRRYKNELMKYRRTAKVVYIVERGHSRTVGGHLKAYDREKGLVILSPKDNKIPRVFVQLSSCPPDYIKNKNKYENTLFIGRIKSWDVDCPFAMGDLMRSIGEAGEIEPETESFLIENEVEFGDFSPEALECLPKQLPWTIPLEEVARRRDFRKECVFTIDPETARDLDDAIHVKELEEDVYEVGVHIADVSYFVKAGTALDKEASTRATSVYLVQKVIPMLPRLLCEKLCSLNPNEDRLTVSVVWKLTTDGKLKDEWMGRSVIMSCAQLSYSHAQDMIDDPSRQWKEDELPNITNGFTASNISWAVNTLNKLANGLRKQRESVGTLRLNQPKLTFTLNKDTGLPSGCDVYNQRESNRLIEELMLLTNMAVAHKIWRAFPDRAMLRRHPAPKEKSAQYLAHQCMELGIPLDVSTAASIQSSLNEYQGTSDDPEVNHMQKMVLVSNCSKIMELARYFSSGAVEKEADFRHYALNVPRYTHFTSPIRRYADIVVHRQLTSSLSAGEGQEFTMSSEEVESQAHHCNKKKKSAKTVQELSLLMFFAIFIRESEMIMARGIVSNILDKAFDVLVDGYGVIKRIYCEQLELEKFEAHHQKVKSKITGLTLEWPTTGGGSTVKQELKVMSVVDIKLTSGRKPLQYEATLLPPSSS